MGDCKTPDLAGKWAAWLSETTTRTLLGSFCEPGRWRFKAGRR
jgi:hypothetical protein